MNLTEKYMSRISVNDDKRFDKPTKTIDNIDKTPDMDDIGNRAIKIIYSDKLHNEIWLARDSEMEDQIIDDGVDLPIFTFADIRKLDYELSNKALLQIYDVKKVFQGASIERAGK